MSGASFNVSKLTLAGDPTLVGMIVTTTETAHHCDISGSNLQFIKRRGIHNGLHQSCPVFMFSRSEKQEMFRMQCVFRSQANVRAGASSEIQDAIV
jgi:hypothetical protein